MIFEDVDIEFKLSSQFDESKFELSFYDVSSSVDEIISFIVEVLKDEAHLSHMQVEQRRSGHLKRS